MTARQLGIPEAYLPAKELVDSLRRSSEPIIQPPPAKPPDTSALVRESNGSGNHGLATSRTKETRPLVGTGKEGKEYFYRQPAHILKRPYWGTSLALTEMSVCLTPPVSKLPRNSSEIFHQLLSLKDTCFASAFPPPGNYRLPHECHAVPPS